MCICLHCLIDGSSAAAHKKTNGRPRANGGGGAGCDDKIIMVMSAGHFPAPGGSQGFRIWVEKQRKQDERVVFCLC